MEQAKKSDHVLMKDLRSALREMVDAFDDSARRLTKKPAAMSLQNLQNTVCRIDAPVVRRDTPLERYALTWTEFVSCNKKSLDKRAIRFLCGVPEIATDVRFLTAVENSGIELNWRMLAGLVRSCHCMWENRPRMGPSVRIVGGLLLRYRGTNQVLRKWQAHAEALLASDAPRIMADKLVGGGRSRASFIDEWRIEPQSDFFRRVVEIATAACRDRLDQLTGNLFVLFFKDLLPWPGWKPSTFKKEVGAVILPKPMSDRLRETIQRFVLHFEGLGDPRLSINRVNWVEVPKEAEDRLIHWLRQENPYVFSEHVYQQGAGWTWKQRASIRDRLTFEDA